MAPGMTFRSLCAPRPLPGRAVCEGSVKRPVSACLLSVAKFLSVVRVVWLAAVWPSAMVTGCAAGGYTVVDLGDLGANVGRASAVNDFGQVVGEAQVPVPGTVAHAFSWEPNTISDLGTLGGQNSGAFDINNAGTICGFAENALGEALPALWTGGSVGALPTLGGNLGAAWGLNNAGAAVGHAYVSSAAYHAALWDEHGVQDLGTLGGLYSVAYDINDQGTAVGSAYDSTGRERACAWGPGGPVGLGGVGGGQWTAARKINDLGQIIFWGTPQGATANRASFWNGDLSSPVIDLGTFGGDESWAYGLNSHGFVVGRAQFQDWTYHAFVWDGAALTDLGTLGGASSSAFGINDQGVIVGYAYDASGRARAVEWVPVPEPAGGAFVGLGGLAFFLCGKYRRRRAAGSYCQF